MSAEAPRGRQVGRYLLFDELASGGMATVYLGRLVGVGGFARTVAIKRLHAQFAKDPEFSSMFLDEARMSGCVRHGNVVSTMDVVSDDGELFLVMEYIHGESLAKLWRAALESGRRPPVALVVGILAGALHGLHAAHEATSDRGEPLGLVHRDVSPQNILLGTDGIARMVDFGIAKAKWRVHTTREGALKGKIRYMAPEQLAGESLDRRADVFSAAVVLWEMLTARRLFEGDDPNIYVHRLLGGEIDAPRAVVPDVPAALDEAVMRGLSARPEDRFATARDFAVAIEAAVPPASPREIGDWVELTAGPELTKRRERTTLIEQAATPNSQAPAALPEAVAARLEDARGRIHRSELPTVPPTELEATHESAAEPAVTPSPSLRVQPRSRTRARVGLAAGLLVLIAGALLLTMSRRAPAVASASLSVPVSVEAPRPTPAAPEPAPPPALRPSDSAPAVSRAEPKPPARVSASKAPTVRPSVPPASPKRELCMKQRADGVVYFEPCP